MQLVIDRELASGPSLAVVKLAAMLDLQGKKVASSWMRQAKNLRFSLAWRGDRK